MNPAKKDTSPFIWIPSPDPLPSSQIMAAHTIISYALLAAYISAVAATDYTVGDSSGWTISINYMAWSTKYNFTVGDALRKKLKSHLII